jgi:DNA-binding NtrC family response regulator
MVARKRQADVVFAPVMRSPAMRKLDQVLRVVASKDVTVTLTGESGSGKEVLARRIHELSERKRGPFVPINCAAIPDALFESELFGHERGAFTGASERAKGKIDAAETGTLFLDEIGEMPFAMQAKLLRFLENRRYMRLGGTTKLEADVRLLFATLQPLEQEVRAGRFRADLFYRIQGVTLRVPPLRARRPDIAPLLVQSIAQLSARHGVVPPKFSRQAKAAFLRYDWPGNVRELRNVVETVCLLRAGKQVRLRDLPESMLIRQEGASGPEAAGDALLTLTVDRPLDELVERIIEMTLAQENGSVTRAAARLRISTRTIQRHLSSGLVHALSVQGNARSKPPRKKNG